MIIYTCQAGPLKAPPEHLEPKDPGDHRFVFFTDQEHPEDSRWEFLSLKDVPAPFPYSVDCKANIPERWLNRWYKTHPHILFPGEDTLYLDARMELVKSPDDVITAAEGRDIAGFAVFSRCPYQESLNLIKNLWVPGSVLKRQMAEYKRVGFKFKTKTRRKATAGGFLFRRGTPQVALFNEFLWSELVTWGHPRDQVSIDFAAWKAGMEILHFQGHFLNNPFARVWTLGRWFEPGRTMQRPPKPKAPKCPAFGALMPPFKKAKPAPGFSLPPWHRDRSQ